MPPCTHDVASPKMTTDISPDSSAVGRIFRHMWIEETKGSGSLVEEARKHVNSSKDLSSEQPRSREKRSTTDHVGTRILEGVMLTFQSLGWNAFLMWSSALLDWPRGVAAFCSLE